MAYDAIRRRNVRGGRLRPPTWGGPVRPSPAAQRRRDLQMAQEETKRKFPNLDAKLERIAKRIREARLSGRRFAYKEPLRDLYEMAYDWNEADKLDARIRHVANLRGIPIRANANPFSVLIKALLGQSADRKTVSRWSVQLKKAMDDDVAPKDLNTHI